MTAISRPLSILSLTLVALTAYSTTAAAENWIVPAAAHAPGAAGTVWRTDLRIVNPSEAAAEATVILLVSGADNTALDRRASVSIPPGGQIAIGDVLDELFDETGTAGLLVESENPDLLVTSRTFNLAPDGTYGQFIPGIRAGDAVPVGQPGHLVFLTADSDFRTNLGFAAAGPQAGSVEVTLVAPGGAVLGSASFGVEAWGQRQVNDLFGALGAPGAGAARAVVRATAPVVVYASMVDNRTGDPIAVMAQPTPAGAADLVLPAAARAPGAADSLWRTDLRIFGPGGGAGTVTLAYHPKAQAVTNPATATRSIGAGELLVLSDVMNSVFGLETANGGLRITADVPLLVLSRTYNQGADGTFGQAIPAVPAGQLVRAGEQAVFSGLAGGDFRSNAGLFNVGSTPATFDLELTRPSGARVGSTTLTLAGGEMNQLDGVVSRLGGSGPGPFSLRIESGDASTYATFVSVIDNLSNDSVYEGPTVLRSGAAGDCVEAELTAAGRVATYRVTGYVGGIAYSGEMVTTFTETTPTMGRSTSRSEYEIEGETVVRDVDVVHHYTILASPSGHATTNDLSLTTTTTISGLATTSHTTMTYTPPLYVGPFTRWCGGETWTTPTVTIATVQDGVTVYSGPTDITNGVVEAIGEPLTTPAGTFTTVRIMETQVTGEDPGSRQVRWLSPELGIMLKEQAFDSAGTLKGSFEVITVD